MKRSILSVLLAVIIGTGAQGGEPALEAMLARMATQDARMAAQEARMVDLEAKLRSRENGTVVAENITSLRKNATVTIGGLVTTGYFYQNYKKDSVFNNRDGTRDGSYSRRAESKTGSLEVSDAELYVAIEVNDHFDAYLSVDLHNVGNESTDYYAARAYWIRWKNICNTGFGIKVGRDDLVFGNEGYGYLDSWAAGAGDGLDWVSGALFSGNSNIFGAGFDEFSPVPLHNGWKRKGVTQVTPYWESSDGKLLAEVSFMQNIDSEATRADNGVLNSNYVCIKNGETLRYRSKNDGLGTMSARVAWKPIEDLKLTAGIINYHNNAVFQDGGSGSDQQTGRNNTAFSLAFDYSPRFLNRLTLWGQWIHGWNVGNYRGLDSDVVNAGASWNFTDNFTVFAQGDWLRSKYDFTTRAGRRYHHRGTGWAAYAGANYTFANGVILEGGWRRESITYREFGIRTEKYQGDTIYGTLGFEF